MKKRISKKLSEIEALNFLRKAKTRTEQLLPASAPKSAVQLPLPKTPFDRYQRNKLIRLLNFPAFVNEQSVLEVGCGIGDLLAEMYRSGPKELYGVDSSEEMIALAREYLQEIEVDLAVADPQRLPFPEKSFDVVLVMFELQHIFNKKDMERVIREVCRVSRQWVILVEETGPEEERRNNLIVRPGEVYRELFKRQKQRFHLRKTDFLHVSTSRYIYTGASNPWHWLRWLLSPLLYLMGFPAAWMKPPVNDTDIPESDFALFLQRLSLPLATGLDDIFAKGEGITVMRFERERLFRRG